MQISEDLIKQITNAVMTKCSGAVKIHASALRTVHPLPLPPRFRPWREETASTRKRPTTPDIQKPRREAIRKKS